MSEPQAKHTPPEEAIVHFEKGKHLEKQGQLETALTEYRRAVLKDDKYFEAHMAVGRMCRNRSEMDKVFLTHSFESFRKAINLDMTNQEAHDQYIMVNQKMGKLDSLLDEYDALVKKYPENEIIKKSKKNIMSISMAMMPQQSTAGDTGDLTKKLRKLILVVCIAGFVLGVGLMVSPAFLSKSKKFSKEQLKNFTKIGAILTTAAVGGFIGRAFIK